MKHPSIGIALSGGSALGIAHIGVLQSLRDHHIPVSCISGTSAGSVVAACHAFGADEQKIVEKLNNFSWGSITRPSFSRYGLISNANLGELLRDVLGARDIADARIPLAIVATNISTGKKVVFRKGNLIEALLASTAIPGMFTPVTIDGHMFVDGGITENLPLAELDALGAELKIGVNVVKKFPHSAPKDWFDVINRTIHVLAQAQYSEPAANEILIEPNLEKYTASDFGKFHELISEGYRAATLKVGDIGKITSGKRNAFQKILDWMPVEPNS